MGDPRYDICRRQAGPRAADAGDLRRFRPVIHPASEGTCRRPVTLPAGFVSDGCAARCSKILAGGPPGRYTRVCGRVEGHARRVPAAVRPRPTPAGVIVPRDLRIECAGDDLPWDLVPGYQQLLNHGRVVWGARCSPITGAAPGEGDLPGMSLWSPDPYYDDRPGELSSLASTLYAWRDGPMPPPDPAAAEAVRILDDEHDHVIRLPLPPSLTGGRPVFMGVTVFCRRQLPAGFLVERIYPLLVWPEHVDTHLILPLKWWPPRLIEQSRAAAARKLAELEQRQEEEGDPPQVGRLLSGRRAPPRMFPRCRQSRLEVIHPRVRRRRWPRPRPLPSSRDPRSRRLPALPAGPGPPEPRRGGRAARGHPPDRHDALRLRPRRRRGPPGRRPGPAPSTSPKNPSSPAATSSRNPRA